MNAKRRRATNKRTMPRGTAKKIVPVAKADAETTRKCSKRLRPCARGFLDSLREFLTPAIWREVHQARDEPRRSQRWTTQPLILTLLMMTWCCGDSQAERFEAAKGFTAVCLSGRRRPGKRVQGFQKALAKVPLRMLRALALGLRRRLEEVLELAEDGFIAFGCDGSSLECPRTAELEKRLDPSKKKEEGGAPQIWVTALVHLRTGLLWSWRLGKGYNRERMHLLALLPTLPKLALVVADPGYNGYPLAQALTAAGVSFLIRMSAKDSLYVTAETPMENYREGEVWLWPQEARRLKLPPLRVRLIRVRSQTRKNDVWLLTNVLDGKRLTEPMANRYYRWRWENEGLFRTFKRTLAKVKLTSRTVRLAHREAEGALLATQLLLAQGTRGLLACPRRASKRRASTKKSARPTAAAAPCEASAKKPPRCSPRKVLLTMRDVILGRIGLRAKAFSRQLADALREDRQRTSSKACRDFPRRVAHRAVAPPHLRVLTTKDKLLAEHYFGIAL